METKFMTTTTFTHPAVEAHIANLDAELTDFARLQAKEDALKESELSEPLYNIKVKEYVRSRVQMTIDFIKNTFLVTAMVYDANEIDKNTQKKVQEITNETNDRLQVKASLKRKLATIIIDPLKKKYGKWLILVALLVGVGDGALAFGSFRSGAYTVLQALLAALAIAAVISVSHLLYARWIKRASTGAQRTTRIFAILLIAFIFFAWIGNLRASATNNTVNIALDGIEVSAVSSPHINGWAIAIISFVLFAAVLFLSLLLWKSKEERLKEQDHERISGEIAVIEKEIDALAKERSRIEDAATQQKSEARKIFNYVTTSITKVKNIGRNALTEYKKTYARFHNDIVPAFFSAPYDMVYDESFKFQQPQKTEPV